MYKIPRKSAYNTIWDFPRTIGQDYGRYSYIENLFIFGLNIRKHPFPIAHTSRRRKLTEGAQYSLCANFLSLLNLEF